MPMKALRLPGLLLLAVALLAACAGPAKGPSEQGLAIYFIDIEGGAATLIVTPAGESILVDSGVPGDRDPGRIVRTAREEARLRQIDHHIITHWDLDHYGGTEEIGRRIPILHYYDHGPSQAKPDPAYQKGYAAYVTIPEDRRRTLKPGDTIPLRSVPGGPPIELRILASNGQVIAGDRSNPPECPAHPGKPDAMNDNAGSIAFVLAYGLFRFYDGADLLWNFEHRLACPENRVGPVDVFQVTHHGLALSNHPALIQALNPRVAIMNNGDRKGCDRAVLKTLKESPGLEALYQCHLNLGLPPEEQAPPHRILSRERQSACPGGAIVLRVSPDGSSYTVSVGKDGRPERFETRSGGGR
jgi:competence protein ComEC